MQNMWLKNQVRNRNEEYSEYKSRGSNFSRMNIHVIDDVSENSAEMMVDLKQAGLYDQCNLSRTSKM